MMRKSSEMFPKRQEYCIMNDGAIGMASRRRKKKINTWLPKSTESLRNSAGTTRTESPNAS